MTFWTVHRTNSLRFHWVLCQNDVLMRSLRFLPNFSVHRIGWRKICRKRLIWYIMTNPVVPKHPNQAESQKDIAFVSYFFRGASYLRHYTSHYMQYFLDSKGHIVWDQHWYIHKCNKQNQLLIGHNIGSRRSNNNGDENTVGSEEEADSTSDDDRYDEQVDWSSAACNQESNWCFLGANPVRMLRDANHA